MRQRQVGRPRGRVKPHRPVLGARVPEEFYARIKVSAAKSGRTLSEELIWRAQQGFEWEAKFKQVLSKAGLAWAYDPLDQSAKP
jgi:hypothetical protein